MNKIQPNRKHVIDLQSINNKEKQIRQTMIDRCNKKLTNLLNDIPTRKKTDNIKMKAELLQIMIIQIM